MCISYPLLVYVVIHHSFVESKVIRKYSLLFQYQKCSNVQKSMLAYALLLTWNLEPPCGSVSLQSERGREGGEEGGRERGRGGRREGGREGVTPLVFMHNVFQ